MSGLFDISTPQKRERFLLMVGGVMFIVVLFVLFNYFFGSASTKLRRQRDQLRESIVKLEADVQQKDQIKKRLGELNVKSLPPGDSLAQSLYQNWLIDTAYSVGLRQNRIDQGSISPMKDLYRKYTFTLHGRGTLEQIAEFLRRFHKTEYLHLIRRVSPRAVANSREMDVSITVEALGLPKARPSRTLPKMSDGRLVADVEERDILKQIAQRNLFAAYSPPETSVDTQQQVIIRPHEFDHSPYCYVEGIVYGKDGKPQVWVNQRTQGKISKLGIGDMFRLGGVRCYVRSIDIDQKRATFEAAGGFYTIRLGKSFAEYD